MKRLRPQAKIILASASPWRKRLLARHGIPCRIHVSAFKETKRHQTPRHLVLENAVGKALYVARHYSSGIVIGVDTVGVLGKKILGKPRDRKDAERMLRSLRGRQHYVISGLAVLDAASGRLWKRACKTIIVFRKFSDAELSAYLDSNHWKGKAGSYAIQGRAKGFVEKIIGDVTNVVGLPVPILKDMLKKKWAV